MSEVAYTSGVELLIAAFRVLDHAEQTRALRACHSVWIKAEEEAGSETGRLLASLKRAAEMLGRAPGIDDYRRIRLELAKDGEELAPVSRITKHFNGSWHIATEALDLSQVSTPRQIEERFRKRRLGKVWRYSEETLGQTLARAVEDIGHIPRVAEFDWWRQRQIELGVAQGQDVHLPSATPYRRLWGSWEQALLHFGYGAAEVAKRLERSGPQ
jgi:hypothetical protein